MHTVVLVLHLIVAVALIGIVLMQRSEGGALGIGGGGGSLISGRGAADVLVRITGGLAVVFFMTSITLTILAGGQRVHQSVVAEDERPSWYETIIPKDLFSGFGQKETKVVSPPAKPVAAPASVAAPQPAGDVIPGIDESMPRAGPIDIAPLEPTAAAPAPAAPKVAVVNPKPARAAAEPKPVQPKPPVRASQPAPVKPAESAEPAAPPARIGPDE